MKDKGSIDITTFIPTGESNRITSRELTKLTGLTGVEIRACINKARANFIPIASDRKGYFIAETEGELSHTIAHINHRIYKMIQAREGLKKAAEGMKTETGKGCKDYALNS